ncbi:MAG TPA: molybdenum cofactor biosynthesis protein MoaE [Chloroflexota bacterium]|nr:molybdenum cofactor biosynthesis protein MoaE [Chloroflexota bacterium]
MLSVRLFASIREVVGANTLQIELPENATVDMLTRAIQARYPQLRELPGARVSVNFEYVDANHPIRPNDELAVIPPVSGGSGHFEITRDELTADGIASLVGSPDCGAVTVFLGTARRISRGREVEYLEYEAYPEMAIRKLEQIAEEIRERWGTSRIAVRHRVGRVDLGEASVAIAVATEHRAEGFAACQYAIDRLKEIVPIWKKEVWVGGGEWIGWDCAVDPMLEAAPPRG